MTREYKLRLIYRHTHRDYKGKIDGVKSIMVMRHGRTCLVALIDLTETEIERELPYAVRKEVQRARARAT